MKVLFFATVFGAASVAGATGAAGAASAEIALPDKFWIKNQKARERLQNRDILVSVRTETAPTRADAVRLIMSGVGWVRRAPQDVFDIAVGFEKLTQVSDHFREVKFDKKTSRLFIFSQALGYQARMLFQVELDPQLRQIRFHVIDGHFLGLRGAIELAEVKPNSAGVPSTEMSVLMAHEARELPIPKILIGFALEIVTKNVAEKMRRYIETIPAESKASSL